MTNMTATIAAAVCACMIGISAAWGEVPAESFSKDAATAISALHSNANFACVCIVKKDDQKSKPFIDELTALVGKNSARMGLVLIDAQSEDNAKTLKVLKFDPKRTPMPFGLVLASNGAVTGSFIKIPTEEGFSGFVVSAEAARVMKALQDGRNVILSVLVPGSPTNAAITAVIGNVTAEAKYKDKVVASVMDPADKIDSAFLKKFNVTSTDGIPVTVLLGAPSKILGTFKNTPTKNQLTTALDACGCAGGS